MLNMDGDSSFDIYKQNTWKSYSKQIKESVFGIEAQTKTCGVGKRRECGFHVGIV